MSVGGISFMTAYCRGQDAGYSFIDASQRRLCWVHVARNVVAIADSSDVSIHRNSIDTGKMRRSSLDPTFLLA